MSTAEEEESAASAVALAHTETRADAADAETQADVPSAESQADVADTETHADAAAEAGAEVDAAPGPAAGADAVRGSEAGADAGSGVEAGTASQAERRSRWRAAWVIRLIWLAGLIAAGIGLYFCYLYVSRTARVSSDGASNALQAWEMLHGNPLLRGWTVTDVSFYTTELPEYLLVEMVRGLHADVLHVSAAISYTLVVLIGAMLARGRATGREGIVRMLIAAGIMVAPQLGPGVFILVFQPDHIGTQAPLLLTWLVLDRFPRRWYTPVVVGAMLAWVDIADRLVLLIGVAPLAAVSAIRAYQALVQRREGLRGAWFDLSLLAAAGVSAEVTSAVVKQIGDHGGFGVLPVQNALAPITEMSAHSWLAVESVFGLYGADFFGITSPGLNAGIAFLHLIGLALALWGLWLVLRHFFSCEDRIAQVLAVGILINVAAYLLSTTPTTYWSAREMAGVLPAGAVIAGRMLGRRFLTARLVPAMTVVLACYLAALGYTVAQPSKPAITQDLADWLAAHHLTYGLSSYGVANATTLASGGAVSVRSVSFYNNDAAPGPYEFDQTWYDSRSHDANFVVLMNPPVPLDEIATWEIRDVFGRPSHVYDFGPYIIMTYDTNLLTDLSPSLPPPPPPGAAPAAAPSATP
jgi:hypothetical protein